MKDIATSSTTKYILEKYHLQALKKYGQNFLIDTNVIHNIVDCANIDIDTCVIEIGPGIGALTQILARTAGFVRCYEIDVRFKPVYKELLQQDNIDFMFQDFLEVDIKEVVSELKKQYKKVCIVANLPYYITTDLIEKVVLSNSAIDCLVVMVQKEVAKKLSGTYKSPLTMSIADMGTIEYMFSVSKNVFMPVPHVDSAILKITMHSSFDAKLYLVLQICFTQRRKTIYNNLKQVYPDAATILEYSHIEKNKRSEQLTIDDFKEITKNI